MRKSEQQFINELNLMHPNLKLISKYKGVDCKIIVKDQFDIEYFVRPSHLLNGCSPSIESAINKTLAFQQKLKILNPQLKLISEYSTTHKSVIVEDELGVKYKTTPSNLLQNINTSIVVAIDKTFAFNAKASKVHNNEYNYDLVNYINNKNKVLINCKRHGNFYQTPSEHLLGRRCRKCAIEDQSGPMESVFKYAPDNLTNIYFFRCYNETEEFYKIGLSNDPKQRTYNIPYNVEIICTTIGTVGELFPIEKEYHGKFQKLNIQYIPKIFFAGYTECFK